MADLSDMDYTDKLVFLAEWYDFERSHQKNFYLQYYPFDNTVELFDKDRHRVYLRRAVCEGVSVRDMFVGNTVRIYGRQLNIVDYGDIRTKNLISKKNERTLALFKPTTIKDLGTIITFITQKNYKFMKMKMCNMTRAEALEFYSDKKGDSFLPFMIEQLISGPVVAVDLVGEDAVNSWRALMGPKDPAEARSKAPESLRAIYGHELASNGFHGADTTETALRESNFFFPKAATNKPTPKCNLLLKNSTCCIVKPHAVEAGNLGHIINEIMNNGFKINAMEIFYLSNANAEEFLEVYKGVVSDFNAMMLSFIDGPLVAMEIAGKDGCDIHSDFRKFTGPFDPEIARQIRPNTLRAKFGIDKYRNAIHCTDLPEDTTLELEYFFRILQD